MGCSRQKKIAVPRRETRSYFEFCWSVRDPRFFLSSSLLVAISDHAERASAVIVWWWQFKVLECRQKHEAICFCQAAWQG